MIHILSSFKEFLRRSAFLVVLVGSLNIVTWFLPTVQPSYADLSSPEEAIEEIQKDLENPEQLYEKATEISKDPKMGVEKKYDENIQEYYQENPEQGGILGGAKKVIDEITTTDKN